MVKVAEGYNPQFDIDLRYGVECERLVAKMLTGFHEVKSDRQALATGNLFIEFESRGAPSGIETTQADWWTFHLADGLFTVISTQRLKELCIKTEPKTVLGGDQKSSKGYLLPLREIYNGKTV